MVELLFEDLVERINEEEVEWRCGFRVVFVSNGDSFGSHFVRRVEGDILDFILATPLVTLDFQNIFMRLISQESHLVKVFFNFFDFNQLVYHVFSIVINWFVNDLGDHFVLITVIHLKHKHIVVRMT